MKKQGFTLIELMVVIVIMGILAAVAVPKLFGMIAKSKASEVGPAAGTYVKLQQAYVSESNVLGGWTMIGYSGPGSSDNASSSHTTNFGYSGSIGASATTNVQSADDWAATNLVPLNDCAATGKWSITSVPGNGGTVTFNAGITGNGCEPLTPSYCKIGTSGSCTAAANNQPSGGNGGGNGGGEGGNP